MITIDLKTMSPDEINEAFCKNYMELKEIDKKINPNTDQDVLMGIKLLKKGKVETKTSKKKKK